VKALFVLFFALQAGALDLSKIRAQDIKEKGCPLVNGKKDCTVKEVKDKALDLKKKFLK
jgi:hypothetical protein